VQQEARIGGEAGAGDVLRPLRPVPLRSRRPWAGHRLGGPDELVGELWVAGPDSVVAGPIGHGRTLDELAAAWRESLVGTRAMALLGPRFPLLVKLIDAGDWLSLQVHPGNELAAEHYGPDALGKTEAWLVLDGASDSLLVTGPRRDLTGAALRDAIRDGTVGREHCETRPCRAGEALLLEAGTMHAIGAGAFVYEIEQPSDLTFRMSDWGRPSTPDRHLHVAESLRAVRTDAHARPAGTTWTLDGGALTVREFRLEIVDLGEHEEAGAFREPQGRSLEVLTAIAGVADVVGDGWYERLTPYDTLVVPASVAAYRIAGPAGVRVCVGSIP
jgi:mannose-6-phosphate isomerase